MDLGVIPSRCQNQNLLHKAVHEENGLVWSDGHAIYLAPISVQQGQLENQSAVKLGEFEDETTEFSRGVRSVHWSDNIDEGLCFMCVVHDKNISIWKVEGCPPKLTFKQVRKINVQPLSQGCLWNPGRDLLCVVCSDQCSLYYSHLKNKGSHVLPQLDSETVRCGTWLTDGTRLVLCAGTSLLVYVWSDLDKSISQYSAIQWNVPDLDGSITTVIPLSSTKLLCAAELPLETLCKQQDAFVLPDLLNTQSSNSVSGEQELGEIIRPKGDNSITSSLFNLPAKTQPGVQDSSQLVCVQLDTDGNPEKLSGSQVKGILTPDILLYQPQQKLVIVGSNTQTVLQVFTVGEQQLTKTGELELEKEERPKGISNLPRSAGPGYIGILVLVGRKSSTDSAFLPSSTSSKMKCVLKFFTLKSGEKKKVLQTVSVPDLRSDGCNGFHADKDDETPKRPVRKKKSMSKQKVSAGLINGSNGVQLQVADSSDSSDASPRDSRQDPRCQKPLIQEQIQAQVVGSLASEVAVGAPTYGDSRAVRDDSGIRSGPVEQLKLTTDEFPMNSSCESSPRDVSLQLGSKPSGPSEGRKIVAMNGEEDSAELEIERTDFSSQRTNFENLSYRITEPDGSHSALVEEYLAQKRASRADSPPQVRPLSPPADNKTAAKTKPDSSVESLDDIETQLKDQNQKIVKLQEHMDNLNRRFEETTLVFPTRYQTINKPELITVSFRCRDGFEIKKTFVLDNGRLQLEPVKQAFSLETVELLIDDELCVTGCNIDGYIPIRFSPGTTLHICGKPSPT